MPHVVQKRQSQQQLLDIIGEHCLTQLVNIHITLVNVYFDSVVFTRIAGTS